MRAAGKHGFDQRSAILHQDDARRLAKVKYCLALAARAASRAAGQRVQDSRLRRPAAAGGEGVE